MSLRAEYSWDCYGELGLYSLTVYHQPIGSKEKNPIWVGVVNWRVIDDNPPTRIISAHMEKVTQELANGAPRNYEQEEENDRLAHRGDQQQQEEKDQY